MEMVVGENYIKYEMIEITSGPQVLTIQSCQNQPRCTGPVE